MDKYMPIREQLEQALAQAMEDDVAIDYIELTCDAMDRLLATDPLGINHKSFGLVQWHGIDIKLTGYDIFGQQYRVVTRPRKPSEAGHTIRGKLPY